MNVLNKNVNKRFAAEGQWSQVFTEVPEIESMIFHIFPNIDEKFFGLSLFNHLIRKILYLKDLVPTLFHIFFISYIFSDVLMEVYALMV